MDGKDDHEQLVLRDDGSVEEKTMEEEDSLHDEDEEIIDDAFECCVCLDLLYKPIVLACGHVSCFWCVHRAMSGLRESHCPICRCEYTHFPSICILLHNLLLKLYPAAYKRRGRQILEEEKELDCFSPQIDDSKTSSYVSNELNLPDCHPTLSINLSDVANSQNCKGFICKNTSTIGEKMYAGICQDTLDISPEENILLENDLKVQVGKMVSVNDLLCLSCKKLLFQPVVLNCGHVYCKSCITVPESEPLKCQLCQSSHPKGALKVCLELDHFLEERFAKEYRVRREAIQLGPVHPQQGTPTTCVTQVGKLEGHISSSTKRSWSSESKLHIGAGCDYCGMYPIIGDRYRCRDCVEAIGFDLCGECYNTSSKRPGRFNQQHTADHKFELVRSDLFRSMLLRLIPEHSEGQVVALDVPVEGSEDPDVTDSTTMLLRLIPEDSEDESVAPDVPDDGSEAPDVTVSTIQ